MSSCRKSSRRVFGPILSMLLAVFVLGLGCQGKNSNKSTSPVDSGSANAPDVGNVTNGEQSIVRFRVHKSDLLSHCGFQNGSKAKLFSILEIIGGGVSCFDFDLDDNLDFFFAGGGKIDPESKTVSGAPSKLLRGSGGWELEDCSAQAGLITSDYVHGMTSADFDQDGFPDAIVYGYHGAKAFRNLGDGTFLDCTKSMGLARSEWTTSVAWLDVDSDMSLDLHLAGYVDWSFESHRVCPASNQQPDVCSPTVFSGVRNVTMLNQSGAFTPTDALKAPSSAKTLGLLSAEFERGQGVGLYVANDLAPNFLFVPSAKGFEESAMLAGAAVDDQGVANGSMGLALLDFNNDQLFDIFVTNLEHELMGLYLNRGANLFEHSSRGAGLNSPTAKAVGFGAVAADFDGDGDEDIIFNNGHVHYHPDAGSMQQRPIFLQNKNGQKLARYELEDAFFGKSRVGRGLATADIDRDGDLDLVSTSLFEAPVLVENQTTNSSQWLSIRLVGTLSPRTPIGTTVHVKAGKRTLARQLYGGGSYLSQSEQILHYAWPEEHEKINLTVRWPTGAKQNFTVEPNQRITIVEMRDTVSVESAQ